ncbi:MAG: tRNA pseudouridine(38-40) synthase TruA [Actinomycetota bacterium]
MPIIRLDLAYDGTGFRGWARQRDQRTVQGVLEDAIERVLRERPRLSVAGRTDAGVQARGQVASFAFDADVDLQRLRRAVNGMLSPEIVVRAASPAPDGFDARHSATAREYRYRIDIGEVPDPFTARFVWHRPGALALGAMREAARGLVGSHDFASFCRSPGEGATTVRNLQRLSISRAGDRVEISARANAFLHQMVRSLVGTLVAVGAGDLDPDSMESILRARSRAAAGRVAPPHGLTLERVVYGRVSPRARPR